jgi:hypothetical protein
MLIRSLALLILLSVALHAKAHDWVMLGRGQNFLSLKPVFVNGEGFQMVLHVRLEARWHERLKERTRSRELLFVRTRDFKLERLIPGHAKPRRSMRADIRDQRGRLLASGVRISVRQTLISDHLHVDDAPRTALDYFAFGAHLEWFAIKRIGGGAEFEHILRFEGIPDQAQLSLAGSNTPEAARALAHQAFQEVYFNRLARTP